MNENGKVGQGGGGGGVRTGGGGTGVAEWRVMRKIVGPKKRGCEELNQ